MPNCNCAFHHSCLLTKGLPHRHFASGGSYPVAYCPWCGEKFDIAWLYADRNAAIIRYREECTAKAAHPLGYIRDRELGGPRRRAAI